MIGKIFSNNCPRRERRKEARPGELLAAALELFVEKGYAATRSEEVARRAGVSKGTLFLYFASKEELFKAVVRENIAGRFAEWNTEFETFEGSTPEMLRYALMMWWERIGKTPAAGITKLMMSEAVNFPELAAFYQQEVIEPGHELIRRILQRGVDRGEFRPMDMEQAIYGVLAPMIFLMSWKHSFGACVSSAHLLVPERYLEQQLQILLHGLCTPDAGHKPLSQGKT
ncbi:MAG: TetR/AcrR family transcriptional regulator [Burkholderiaceae bacterium]|jgi:TetR/AcrR family transcriptional regulator|nr:TetR/AcrR family transcriptional regulator [Burkholderiaceae bacterium]